MTFPSFSSSGFFVCFFLGGGGGWGGSHMVEILPQKSILTAIIIQC